MTVEFDQMFHFIRWKQKEEFIQDGKGKWQSPDRFCDDIDPLTDLELYNLYLESNET